MTTPRRNARHRGEREGDDTRHLNHKAQRNDPLSAITSTKSSGLAITPSVRLPAAAPSKPSPAQAALLIGPDAQPRTVNQRSSNEPVIMVATNGHRRKLRRRCSWSPPCALYPGNEPSRNRSPSSWRQWPGVLSVGLREHGRRRIYFLCSAGLQAPWLPRVQRQATQGATMRALIAGLLVALMTGCTPFASPWYPDGQRTQRGPHLPSRGSAPINPNSQPALQHGWRGVYFGCDLQAKSGAGAGTEGAAMPPTPSRIS